MVGSILLMKSITGVFSFINIFQLYILLPMIPDYFPYKVTQFILGNDFVMFSLDFIPVEDIPFVKEIKKWVKYSQPDGYLNDIGLSSGSCIVNYLPIMVLILLIGVFHLIVLGVYLYVKSNPKSK